MRIAFIGAGGIAGNYLTSLKKLGREVSAICDVQPERALKAAESLGNCAVYHDHRQMLDNESPDVVFVAIPPGAHSTQVADAARASAALFVAKPVALDLQTSRAALQAIGANGVINQAGYMARYSDITEKARSLAAGRILGLGLGRFMCRMGTHPWWGKQEVSGGQMLEQSTHVFDLLRLFLGEVAEVHATGHGRLAEGIADFEDSTVCNLRFKSGAVGNVASTCCANVPDGFSAEVSGRDFYLRLVMDTRLIGRVDNEPVEFEGQETGYFRQVQHFLEAVEAKDQTLVRSSYADAARTLAVTVAANRSLKSGRPEPVEEI